MEPPIISKETKVIEEINEVPVTDPKPNLDPDHETGQVERKKTAGVAFKKNM